MGPGTAAPRWAPDAGRSEARVAPFLVACLLDDGLGVGDHVHYPLAECLCRLGAPGCKNGDAILVIGVLGG
jgi:hypothetical protein